MTNEDQNLYEPLISLQKRHLEVRSQKCAEIFVIFSSTHGATDISVVLSFFVIAEVLPAALALVHSQIR